MQLVYIKGMKMTTISIGELQKNISIFKNLSDVVEVIDKRANKKVAKIIPEKNTNIVASLAGKYKTNIKYNKEKAWEMYINEKYGSN